MPTSDRQPPDSDQSAARDERLTGPESDAGLDPHDRARWLALMDESPFGIVVYRPDGTVKAANDGMQRLFRLTDEEAEYARNAYNILEDPQLKEKGLDEAVKTAFAGHPASLPCLRYDLRTPVEGRSLHRWVEGVFFPVHGSDGNLREVVAIQIDVSDRMETEQRLRETQEVLAGQVRELDQLYAAEPVGLCLMDTDLRYLRINETLAAMNGLSPDAHIGRTFREVLPDVAPMVEPVLRRVIETGETVLDLEMNRAPATDPETIHSWLSAFHPVKDENGVVTGVTTVVTDVTAIKQAQEALKESQHRLQAIIENADIVLWSLDENGIFTLSEGRGLARLGLAPGEVVGQSVFDVYADVPEILEDNRRALAGETVSGTVKVGDLSFAANYLPIFDQSGKPAGSIGIAFDVTDQQQTEAALQQSERRFQQIAENIREVFFLFDAESKRFLYMSPGYEKLTGRSPEEANSGETGLFASVPASDRPIIDRASAELLETGGNVQFEHRLTHRDGSTRWVSVRASAMQGELGQSPLFTGITEDITDRKRAEQERREFEAKVRQAQKLESLGLLAGGIAHDFNNLLMGVLGNADLALLSLSPESPGHEYVERIQTAAQRASELANQMLAYSGKGRFVVGLLDLNRLVEEMRHLLDTVIPKKVRLVFDLEPKLPGIEVDASQIRQVVMNLITNAAEAIGKESGAIRLSSSIFDADDEFLARCELGVGLAPGPYVRLDVSDTGSGIPEDVRAAMFDPFFTTKFTGRGLGLAAVLGIVQSHGAAICVESRLGAGSTFSLLFPPSAAALPRDKPKAVVDREPTPGGTVLVIDDEAIVRQVARAMLEGDGFEVLEAKDGSEGLEIFGRRGNDVDLVLLDMAMPGLDGAETYERLQQMRNDVRVVLSSGYSEEDVVTRLGSNPRVSFVQKPYRRETMLSVVRNVLAGEEEA